MRHPVDRLSCRPKRPAPAQRCSRSPEIAAHDPLKSLLTIPRNICSRCSEIRAHDPAKRAPYVKAQKNDHRDAEAIAEAATRPTMRFVALPGGASRARHG